VPLTMVGPGRRVRLVGVQAGRGLQARLAAMGLVPGMELDVVANAMGGPLVVAINGTRLVLGRGMAHKIMVA
jgi:ferrous iron transport protein A